MVWEFATRDPLVASPVVAKGKVFLATGERRVIAVSAYTGALLWEMQVTGPVDATPAAAGGLLYVGLRDKRLLALDVESGEGVWAFWTDGPIFSSPVVLGGMVYVGSGDGHLYALDAVTGKKRWAFRVGGWVTMSPSVREDAAVAAGGRRIFVVDPRRGRARLRYDTVSPPTGVTAFYGPLAFVASEDGAIRAIDTRQREMPGERFARWWRIQLFIWRMMGEPPPQKGFVWARRFPKASIVNGVAVARDTLYLATKTGTLYALDAQTGAERWKAHIGEGLLAAPVVVGDYLYVGTEGGRILQVDLNSGEGKTLLSLAERGIIALVPAGPHLYVATRGGTVYAVR
ncbi:MAG: PQQ-binding-like beta-propeller repeat protein [Dehalococcoidia bacterium]